MRSFWQRRAIRRQAKDVLQHAQHVLHMQEDVLPAEQYQAVRNRQRELQQALRARDYDDCKRLAETLSDTVIQLPTYRMRGAWVENFEMLVVAIATAMALRAYILQPFKIPTGSMQPTLNGITAVTTEPHWTDRVPWKFVRFVLTGEWYSERVARASGQLGAPRPHPRDPSTVLFTIGGKTHRIPKDILTDMTGQLRPAFHPHRHVQAGEKLWAGRTQRGDHLFVNKVIWNFRRPQRDEIMVFTTADIPTLEPGTHYIKRLVGLPGDRMAIHPPFLIVDGERVEGFFGIDRVTKAENGYAGYRTAGYLDAPTLEWRLKDDQYFALGDNTRNSRDSRYWGPVPEKNLVGPATWVYWPFTSHWGWIR